MRLPKDQQREDWLLEKAASGDRTALEALVSSYKNMAYIIALRIVSNQEDAEEVVQDAFLKAFAGLSTFKKAAKFSTWLYRIVYNTALTSRRSKRIVTLSLEVAVPEEVYNCEENHQPASLEREERKKYVDWALAQLPVEDCLLITLHYMGEKSISEICQIMDKRKSAVKMQLLRARKQLKGALSDLLDKEIKDLL